MCAEASWYTRTLNPELHILNPELGMCVSGTWANRIFRRSSKVDVQKLTLIKSRYSKLTATLAWQVCERHLVESDISQIFNFIEQILEAEEQKETTQVPTSPPLPCHHGSSCALHSGSLKALTVCLYPSRRSPLRFSETGTA